MLTVYTFSLTDESQEKEQMVITLSHTSVRGQVSTHTHKLFFIAEFEMVQHTEADD